MMKMIKTLAVAVAVMASAASLSLAEDAHHPPGAATQQVVPGAPTPPGSGTPNMPGAHMTTPSGMPMMGMMGQGGMGMPDMSMHGMGRRGMAMIDHVEGRIAFLRTELKITDAQAQVWNDFAQGLKDNAKRLAEVRAAVAKSADASAPTLVQRLESQERWLAIRLEGVRAIKTAFVPLYTALSTDQKKAADELLGMHVGLMPAGMMSMGMMPMGGTMMPMGGNVR
jgi:hypothetical protein